MKQVYKIYHANLAFSAIPENKLEEVIDKCYFPLLNFVKRTRTKIGLEISAYSLEIIQNLRPLWIKKFKKLFSDGLIELIGSGYMQIIGPLVPYNVNKKNQEIGLKVYEEILGIKPNIVFVNEQTFSNSLVDLYSEIGYQALIMEWNNAYSLNKKLKKEFAYSPIIVKGIKKELPILWSDSILFQKFQRTIHGERNTNFYINFVMKYTKKYKAVPIYSSDLEIFNFRPGRFETEELILNDEWELISKITEKLKKAFDFEVPSKVLSKTLDKTKKIHLTTSSCPIIVKKQDKYSLSRWAACGRGANYINTLCFKYFREIKNSGDLSKWKLLLKYWGSDYRTHITKEKWNEAINNLEKLLKTKKDNNERLNKSNENFNEKDGLITYEKNNLKILFDKNKGLTLDSIFINQKKFPICTIKHGELDLIKHGADFFTGTTVVESLETKKISDLSKVNVTYYHLNENISKVESLIYLNDSIKERKSWTINQKRNTLTFDLEVEISKFINGSIRVGTITLDKKFATSNGKIKIKNGYKKYETISLKNSEINHYIPKSLIQSSVSGLGCTNGVIKFINDERSFKLKVNQNISYPFVMLQNNKDKNGYLTRVYFSLKELDDTSKVNDSINKYYLSYKIYLN